MLKDGVPLICVNTGCENNMNWWKEEKKNENITQFKFKDGCSVCCIDISKLNNDEDKENEPIDGCISEATDILSQDKAENAPKGSQQN